MVKNQRRWMREWIEFYLMMGVEHFIIYDNDSNDRLLEILQCYIDDGIITYIPWPPKEVPPPIEARTKFEYWQDTWFRDSLETCLNNDWPIHRQGPCQLAAFTDAIRRTKNGVSRWLGIWDVDEYIYPRQHCKYNTMADLLRAEYENITHIKFWGNVFGTSGHVEPARRRPGSPLQALMTEEYTRRAEIDGIHPPFQLTHPEHKTYPFQKVDAHDIIVHGRGKLSSIKFAGGDEWARKSIADPDLVSHSWIHQFEAPGNVVCRCARFFLTPREPNGRICKYPRTTTGGSSTTTRSSRKPTRIASPKSTRTRS
jgi:Glycosyltransferase family 92